MPDDKVFLITGASTGIGAATAHQAAEAGYRLVLAARSEDKLRALADELGGDDRALAVRCDVTEWDDQQALVQRALDAYGRVDVAFANAGFGGARGFKAATPEEWKAMILTNVYGAALTIRAAYDALVATKGHLLLTSSVAGRRALPGSLYSASNTGHGDGRGGARWTSTTRACASRLSSRESSTRRSSTSPRRSRRSIPRTSPGRRSRRAAAAARRRQRDPHPADGAAELAALAHQQAQRPRRPSHGQRRVVAEQLDEVARGARGEQLRSTALRQQLALGRVRCGILDIDVEDAAVAHDGQRLGVGGEHERLV